MPDVKELMREWLDIIETCSFDKKADRVSRDVILRFPFAAPGIAEEVRGFDAAKDYLEKFIHSLQIFRWLDVVILRTEDPELVVATCRSEAMSRSGTDYANKYVIFARFRDGKVIDHIAYSNPLPVTKSFGQDPRSQF
jgi:ketosteroid isomerase-like protein